MDIIKENVTKAIYIELELVLDIYSLVFWNVRFYLDTNFHIQVDNKDVTLLYGKQLQQGIKDILESKLIDENYDEFSIDNHVERVLKMFKSSSKSLKPTVPSIHVIKELSKDTNVGITLFTYIEKSITNDILTKEFLKQITRVIPIHDLLNKEPLGVDPTIIVFGWLNYSSEFERLANEHKLILMNVPQPKNSEKLEIDVESYKSLDLVPFELYNFPKLNPSHEGSLLRVELSKEIKTAELPFWRVWIPIDKIELQGRVVNGYKRGSKELGVPTANLEMCQENTRKIETLLPGVYWGTVQFISSESNSDELIEKYGENYAEKKLQTALSIGWNPSYDNSQRTIESYILDEFDNDFYGEELKLEITHYIRAESNYTSLDHLIMAIHNDIETTKHIISSSQV